MPKALKWGIVIMICILALFFAGYVFRRHLAEFAETHFFPGVEEKVFVPVEEGCF